MMQPIVANSTLQLTTPEVPLPMDFTPTVIFKATSRPTDCILLTLGTCMLPNAQLMPPDWSHSPPVLDHPIANHYSKEFSAQFLLGPSRPHPTRSTNTSVERAKRVKMTCATQLFDDPHVMYKDPSEPIVVAIVEPLLGTYDFCS